MLYIAEVSAILYESRLARKVKNNASKFDADFTFKMTKEELADLRSKYLTANISPKSRALPNVYTEQGIYMLMTVLDGELAAAQSKALIRTLGSILKI